MGLNNYLFIALAIIFGYVFLHLMWIIYQNMKMKKKAKTGVVLEIVLEKDTDTTPMDVEQMWAAFYSGLMLPWYKRMFSPQPYISFEVKSENTTKNGRKINEITFNIWVPEEYESMIESRLLTTYPKAQIKRVENDYMPEENDAYRVFETAEIGLEEHSIFSIRTLEKYEPDPLSSITSAMSNLKNRELAIVQVVTKPLPKKWRVNARKKLERYEKTKRKPNKLPEWTNFFGSFLGSIFSIFDAILDGLFGNKTPDYKITDSKTSVDTQRQREMLSKTDHMPFSIQIRVLVGSPLGKDAAKERVRNIIASFKEMDGPNNGFQKEFLIQKQLVFRRMKNRFYSVYNNDDVLSTIELASFCHLPNFTNYTPGLKKVTSKRNEFSQDVASMDAFAFGIDPHGGERPIGLDLNGRMRHIYVSGMTGVGKSTLLENMIVQDIETGKGVVVVDPHGELVDEILKKISTKREDIFVLDPADIAYPFGMNLLEISSTDPLRRELEKVLVVDAYITVMKRVFGESSIGANTDDLFRMSCSAILDHPEGGGLLEMLLMLTSEVYRKRVLTFVKDPIVKNYWEEVFPALAGQGSFLVQNLNAPLNKIRRFIANGLVANIICQKKSTLNIADAINSGAVILARFSRGDMGFENSALLGSMLISKIQIAAMQRVNIPQEQRVPTYLYVDEFQNFVGDSGGAKSFAEILSEARKYRLGLIIAHQFVEQLRQAGSNFLMEAIFNNCGTTITFRVGASDSRFFEQMYYDADLKKGYKANEIANLGRGAVVMRVMTKTGLQSEPLLAQTFMPLQNSPEANPELVKMRSRANICVGRDEVRDSIQKRIEMDTLVDTQRNR